MGDGGNGLYSVVAHVVSFFAVEYLASYLTEILRRTGRELQMRRDDLAQLRRHEVGDEDRTHYRERDGEDHGVERRLQSAESERAE